MKGYCGQNDAILTQGSCDICNFSMATPRLRNAVVCILHLMIKPLRMASTCESFLPGVEK
jgi:hypothetical protein